MEKLSQFICPTLYDNLVIISIKFNENLVISSAKPDNHPNIGRITELDLGVFLPKFTQLLMSTN